jgi:hypothetical protein
MAERGDQGFEVAPTRIGGSGGPGHSGRRRRAPIILVVLLAIAIPSIAWVGPRIEWRPEVDLSFLRPTPTPVPTPTPRATRAPTPAPATPLPAITIGVGPRPTEPFPVDVGGLRLADPTTGSLGPPLGMRGDTDAIFTSRDGSGWWCVCFARATGANQDTVTVEIRRVDRSGSVTFRRTVGDYKSAAPSPAQDFYTRFDLVISPDQRTAFLASASRAGDEWSVALDAIDLETGKVVSRSDLGRVAIPPAIGPTPAPDQGMMESYFAGPFMRMSPDGERILVWSWVDSYRPTGELRTEGVPQGWLIDADQSTTDAPIGRLTPLERSFAARLRGCSWMAWTSPGEVGAICWPVDPAAQESLTFVLLGPDGTEHGHVDLIDGMNSWIADPLLDRANRMVYFWQPGEHALSRIDLDRLRLDKLTVDPAATGGGPAAPSEEPDSGRRPDWVTFTSDMHMFYGPQLVAEPGDRRLFAGGILQLESSTRFSFASSGIWVFDARELTLLDRWSPLAGYGSIGLSSDGRWLLAAGGPGADEHGNAADWQASITVHDMSDGHPALQLGRLGTDIQVLQVPP